MNSQVLQFAQNAIRSRMQNCQNMVNAPWANQGINAIMSGDQKAGEALADNICKSMGMTREQAYNMARQNMNLPF